MSVPAFRQIWVIQNKTDGLFLTENLFWSRWANKAGRCYDVQSAMDTADMNCGLDGYVLSSFWEPVNA